MSYGLSSDGFTAARQADFLTIIRDDYEARLTALGFTVMPDWGRDTFLGGITESIAYQLGQQSELVGAIYDARNLANAAGVLLDNIALLVGVTRNEATKGTVVLTCTGTDGTVLVEGKIVEGGGSADDARWVLTETVTIGDVTTGTITVNAEAQDAGVIVATTGQIDAIVTTVAGWDTVTNAAAATPGTAWETDGELRARRQLSLQGQGSTSVNAILSAILAPDFVTGAVVVDNATATTTTVDGISVDPYAVAACVAPSTMTTANQALLAAAIFAHVGAGTKMSGDQTATVTKRDGRPHTVSWYFAADTAVDLAWVLAMEAGYVAADVEDALLELVTDYFLTFASGATVYPSPLIALAMTIDGIADVTTLTLNAGATPVTHDADELPILGTHAVS